MLQSDNQHQSQIDEARRRSVDNAELNQLARMMPDPAEDELFDDGTLLVPTSFSPAYCDRSELRA